MVFFSNASSSFGWDSAVGAAKVMKPVRKPQTYSSLVAPSSLTARMRDANQPACRTAIP